VDKFPKLGSKFWKLIYRKILTSVILLPELCLELPIIQNRTRVTQYLYDKAVQRTRLSLCRSIPGNSSN